MLNNMGIQVVASIFGEAEKMCAYLNIIGKCEGVITNDSDALLYGAKIVYKNFSLESQVKIIFIYFLSK
jgi:flap endonuclease GEN